MRMLSEQEANEIEVTWEDQQAINAFSRLNSTYSDIEEELRIKREEREALDDLSMELELADEDEAVLYRIADTFVSLPQPEALERLEADQQQADDDIQQLADKLEDYENQMKGLKVKLYAKFGDNISKSDILAAQSRPRAEVDRVAGKARHSAADAWPGIARVRATAFPPESAAAVLLQFLRRV